MSAKKHYRKLTVDGKVYSYRVGGSYVDIRPVTEPLTRTVVSIGELKGMSSSEVERGQWKGWLSVSPRDLANYIRKVGGG